MAGDRLRVTVVSDYICPWCYVGMARAHELQRAFDLDVAWRPFELHPEIPPEGKHLGRAAAYYEQLRSLARAAGLPFEVPERVPNSRRALEAAEFAREHGAFDPYHRALFEAYFAHGRDIGDPAVLAGLAAACGIDGGALIDALDARRYAATVDELTEDARRQGITGTPTFIFERDGRRLPIVGAQDAAVFENVAERMGAPRRTVAAT